MRRLMRDAITTFKKLQLVSVSPTSNLFKINILLKHDSWWSNLPGSYHQKIGRIIANNNDFFLNNCAVPVKIIYSHTDDAGNGIYKK